MGLYEVLLSVSVSVSVGFGIGTMLANFQV